VSGYFAILKSKLSEGIITVHTYAAEASEEASTLLHSIADHLRTPLTAIARTAELGTMKSEVSTTDLEAISIHATAALELVDSYLMGLKLLQTQARLELEPVSVASTLSDTAHALDGLAKQYGIALELDIAGKYGPVMANPKGLKAALLSLGSTLLEGGPHIAGKRLTLAVHRTPHGIVTGLYGEFEDVSAKRWRKALELHGKAAQPFKALGGSGAGLFVADAILQAMATRLRVGRHLHQQGLATTLQSSEQLTFV